MLPLKRMYRQIITSTELSFVSSSITINKVLDLVKVVLSCQVVIDACQLRSQPENIHKYAANGFLTIITGSKFFCAPPFCGAVLLTPAALMELEAGHEQIPVGLMDYFTRHEVWSLIIGWNGMECNARRSSPSLLSYNIHSHSIA